MISSVKGTCIVKTAEYVVLEAGGIGYKLSCSAATLSSLKQEKEAKLFSFLYVREDALDLYGFLSLEALSLFEILNGISGIGPKAALTLSALGSMEQLKRAIAEKDESFFAGTKGIGRKKVQRIIVELTGKLEDVRGSRRQTLTDEAHQALLKLGYSAREANDALSQVPDSVQGTEARVKAVLKILGR